MTRSGEPVSRCRFARPGSCRVTWQAARFFRGARPAGRHRPLAGVAALGWDAHPVERLVFSLLSLRQLAAPRLSAGIRTREPGSSWLVHRTHCRCTPGSLWPRTSRPWPGIRPCSVSSRLNMPLPLRGPGYGRDLATTTPLASVARTASFAHAFFLSDQSRRACPCCGAADRDVGAAAQCPVMRQRLARAPRTASVAPRRPRRARHGVARDRPHLAVRAPAAISMLPQVGRMPARLLCAG